MNPDVIRLRNLNISGLSNQWKSRDGLFRRFAEIDPEIDISSLPEWGRLFSTLIQELEAIAGPDLYIGSSLACMNFNTRDVTSQKDNVPSIAYLEILDDKSTGNMYYSLSHRRILGNRPTTDWIQENIVDPKLAAKKIRDAMDYADTPVRKIKIAE